MTIKKLPIERANKAIQEGQLWRAKEILSGNIGIREFEPELYQHYGELLLKIGDLIEAGKYLFLSGVRKPEYNESINLYVKKHTKKKHWNVFGSNTYQTSVCQGQRLPVTDFRRK